jgi:hypothetical protein
MVIDGTDPFAAAKPDARLIRLLLRARRFNATLAHGEGIPFAALAQREGVSRSYFTRLVRLSYLAPDITQAILDGRQPRDLTAEKLSRPRDAAGDRAGYAPRVDGSATQHLVLLRRFCRAAPRPDRSVD